MQRLMLAAATLALAGGGTRAHIPTDPPRSGPLLNSGVTLVRVTSLASGQVLDCEHGDGCAGAAPRGGTVVLDTMTNADSSAGLNVAYVNPGSYTGENPSTSAFAIGLAERLFYRAPLDESGGFPLPTDILWNDYACDPTVWPADQPVQELGSFGFVPYFQNAETPLRARTHTLRVQFFSLARDIDHGGFEAEFRVNAGQTGYQGFTIDLSALEPSIRIPRDGLIMVDWMEPNNSGVGCMFTGGDLQNPRYPSPETLWAVGSMDPQAWWFADGVTGEDGPPDQVDPDFDGNSGGVSYLDILNTGALANWQFTAGSPPEIILPHDFACRLIVAGEAPGCACDVNNSGTLNSQDFFDFVSGFFAGEADFNGSGETNSQDFFDFLICFFAGC